MASESGGFSEQLARTRTLEKRFLGRSRDEAVELAGQLSVRLRVVDEQTIAVTADLVANRITVRLRDGVVVDATAG